MSVVGILNMKINVTDELDIIKDMIMEDMGTTVDDMNNPEYEDEMEYMEGLYEGLEVAYNTVNEYQLYFKKYEKIKATNKERK